MTVNPAVLETLNQLDAQVWNLNLIYGYICLLFASVILLGNIVYLYFYLKRACDQPSEVMANMNDRTKY